MVWLFIITTGRIFMIAGIDISKAAFDAAWETGGEARHQCFEYTDDGIAALLAQTPEDAHYVMEATGIYHARLALRLYESVNIG
ncbi:MAG: hypothetical protein RQ736_15020 [Thiogranum sp.]|nr:hypothetical protein [Thiogranum sp.]